MRTPDDEHIPEDRTEAVKALYEGPLSSTELKSPPNEFLIQHMLEMIIKSRWSHDVSFTDLGAGTGILMGWLAQALRETGFSHAIHINGVELVPTEVEIGSKYFSSKGFFQNEQGVLVKDNTRLNLVSGDIKEYQIPPNQHAVFINYALRYFNFEEQVQIIEGAINSLAPNGTAFFAMTLENEEGFNPSKDDITAYIGQYIKMARSTGRVGAILTSMDSGYQFIRMLRSKMSVETHQAHGFYNRQKIFDYIKDLKNKGYKIDPDGDLPQKKLVVPQTQIIKIRNVGEQ